jgi:hypothetical protein
LRRILLIDDDEFVDQADANDELLAARFGVPAGEIARKRDDLTRWVAPAVGGARSRDLCHASAETVRRPVAGGPGVPSELLDSVSAEERPNILHEHQQVERVGR